MVSSNSYKLLITLKFLQAMKGLHLDPLVCTVCGNTTGTKTNIHHLYFIIKNCLYINYNSNKYSAVQYLYSDNQFSEFAMHTCLWVVITFHNVLFAFRSQLVYHKIFIGLTHESANNFNNL